MVNKKHSTGLWGYITKRCVYCGITADTTDHFIPLSFQRTGPRRAGRETQRHNLIPACGECNSIASDLVFSFLGEKRLYIQHRLRKRYKRVLNTPTWTEAELREMGPGLRGGIRRNMYAKAITILRLDYPRTICPDVTNAEISRYMMH